MTTRDPGEALRRILSSGPSFENLWPSERRTALVRALAIVSVLTAFVGLAAWQVRQSRIREIEHEVSLIADQAASHLASWTDGRLAAIQTFVASWHTRYEGQPEVFRRDARVFLERLPGLQALNWVGPDWVIRTTVPNQGNEAALGRDLHTHPLAEVARALTQATRSGKPTRTQAVVEFFQGGRGFAIYSPVTGSDGALVGFVNAVFRVERMVEISGVASQLRGHYQIALLEEEGMITFAPQGEGEPSVAAWPFAMRRRVPVLNRPLVLIVAPTPAHVSTLVTPADRLNLAGALGACGLVGVLAFGVLRRQTELTRLALATAQAEEGILVIGRDARILYANAAAEVMMSRPSLVGRDVGVLSEGQRDDDLLVQIAESLAAGRIWRGRYESIWADGSRHFRDASITPVRGRSGQVESFVGVIRDVTREQELEDKLRHSQKMDAVGRLAGGAAHEFNNLLTVIQGYAEQLVEELDEASDPQLAAVTIQDAAQRAATTVGGLLAFSRRQPVKPERLDLAGEIDRLEGVLRGSLGERISLGLRLVEDLPPVHADASQIQQILVNLCMNARDAMPEGGTVTLRTEEIEIRDETPGILPELAPGRYAALSVSDHGTGMDDSTRARMFEPFFTTKEIGSGTGLGLATVYGIAEQNGGALRVESELGKGTVITLYLPFAS